MSRIPQPQATTTLTPTGPGVSDDNPFIESLFRTMKYRPEYPSQPFDSQSAAAAWVATFVTWYNNHHRHTAIGFVTPSSRHSGADVRILAKPSVPT